MTEADALSCSRRGSGPPLLLIQGLSATQLYWGEPFLAELQRHFDVVAYDHRGIAGSPTRGAGFTMRDLAHDAAELIELQGWRKAGVLGVSMGGMVAQELALLRPDLLEYLVLGCTRAHGGAFGRPGDLVTERLAAAYVHGDARATERNMFALAFSEEYRARAEAWPAFLDLTRIKADPRTSVRQIAAVGGFDARDRLPGLDLPTLVVHGDQDRMVPYEEGVEVGRRIGRSRFETLAGAGHFFWVERPTWTVRALRSFAAEAASGRQPDSTNRVSRIA